MALVERAGVEIHHQICGPAGEPVLLLMGLGMDMSGWELQVPVLAERHRVILVDNRGVGKSAKPPGPYRTAEMADDAIAVLDALAIARAHVVGLSMGGMIAQELALRHPDRVGALVLAATYARPGREIEATSAAGAQTLGGVSSMMELAGRGELDLSQIAPTQVMQFLLPLVFSPEFLLDRRDWLKEMFLRLLANGFTLGGLFAQVGATMTHDTVARLPSLRAPTLVMTGTEDQLVPAHHSDELHRLIPGARLERFDRGTHGFNFEMASRFNRTVLDFLAQHSLA